MQFDNLIPLNDELDFFLLSVQAPESVSLPKSNFLHIELDVPNVLPVQYFEDDANTNGKSNTRQEKTLIMNETKEKRKREKEITYPFFYIQTY